MCQVEQGLISPADTVKRLFEDVDHIFGIKEATGSLERTVELRVKVPDLYIF